MRANLPAKQAAAATDFVIPNTRAVTTNFTLEAADGELFNITDPLTLTDAVTNYPNITFAENVFIKIDDEILRVTAVDSPDVTFARAQLETENNKHAGGTDVYAESYADSTDNTAGGDFNNTTDPLTVTVASYANVDFTVGAVLQIESEKMLVTANDGTDATLARGQYGTSAAAHADAVDILQLEFADSTDNVTADVYTTIPADEYRIAPFTGYLIKRTQDDDEAAVDWESYAASRWFWSGTLVTSTGRAAIVREPVDWFEETPPESPFDEDGALNLELAYQAIVDTLIAGGDAFMANFDGSTYEVTTETNNQRAIKFKKNGVLVGRISAYKDGAGSHSLNIDGVSVPDEGTSLDLSSDAPLGQISSVRMDAFKGGVTVGKFEIISTDADVAYAYLSDVDGLTLNGVDAPEISDGFGVDVNGKILRLRTSKTPASAADTGNAGEWCWDSGFLYVCIASNTWKRATLASW